MRRYVHKIDPSYADITLLVTAYWWSSYLDVQQCVLQYQKHDYAKALDHCITACDGLDGGCCVILGSLHYEALGTTKNVEAAEKYWKKGCELHEGLGCAYLGSLYYNGEGVRTDLSSAEKYYEQGCRLYESQSCQYLGNLLYAQGKVSPAVDYYQRSCDLQDGSSCQILGNLYATGQGVEVDELRSQKLLAQACTRGVLSACPEDAR